MTSIYRVTAVWNGFQGAPGYSKFSFVDLTTDTARNAAGAAVRSFFNTLSAHMLSSWSIQVQSEVQEYDMQTGQFMGAVNMTTTPTAMPGTATSQNWANGTGFVIGWRTGNVWNGRRLQGRTFIVPAVASFDTDGTVGSSTITDGANAANVLLSATVDFGIWGKMMSEASPGNPSHQINGQFSSATAGSVKDMVAQLRSRRL
jgi:hypothetical protein